MEGDWAMKHGASWGKSISVSGLENQGTGERD